jgi:hypothetical protein
MKNFIIALFVVVGSESSITLCGQSDRKTVQVQFVELMQDYQKLCQEVELQQKKDKNFNAKTKKVIIKSKINQLINSLVPNKPLNSKL